MQKNILDNLNIQIAASTKAKGCHLLRYHYKAPQKAHDLTEIQKKK